MFRRWVSSKGLRFPRKFLQWNGVWKPRMVLPSIPCSSSSLHGQMPNDSGLGQGMCQKVIMAAQGSRCRIIFGSRAKW